MKLNSKQNNSFNQNIENNFSSFTEWLFSLSGLDFTIAATTIAILISSKLDTNEQNSIGNFFFLIGQVLITIDSQNITRNAKINNPENLTMDELNKKIEYLYREIIQIKNKNNQ